MEFSKKLVAEKLLLVQLYHSIGNTGSAAPRNPLDVERSVLVDHLIVNGNAPVLYSGVMLVDGQHASLPFALPFRQGANASARPERMVRFREFAAGTGGTATADRIFALASIVDFMLNTGKWHGTVLSHVMADLSRAPNARRTPGSDIASIFDDYPAFRERCIKRLPYDMSLVLLGESTQAA